jgi:hypothetical protein
MWPTNRNLQTLGLEEIWGLLDISKNKIYKPRALLSIPVFYKKYVFIYNRSFLCSKLIYKISEIL